jgi:hypothetical protein
MAMDKELLKHNLIKKAKEIRRTFGFGTMADIILRGLWEPIELTMGQRKGILEVLKKIEQDAV